MMEADAAPERVGEGIWLANRTMDSGCDVCEENG